PLGVFLGVAAGVLLAGIPGALFAIPIIAFVNATLLYLVGRDPTPDLPQDKAAAAHFASLGRGSGRRAGGGPTTRDAPPDDGTRMANPRNEETRSGCSAAPGSPRSGRLPPVRAAHGSGPVRRALHDLDRKGLTGRRGVVDGLTDLGAMARAAQRGLGREDLEIGALGDLPVAEQERALLAGHRDGDHHAGLDDPVILRGLPHDRVLQQLLQVRDAGLHLPLLLAGRVVRAVLLQI